jgi:hypothetical protein
MSFNFTILSKNPADISAEEMEALARTMRGLDRDINVTTEVKPREGKGITWAEILATGGNDWQQNSRPVIGCCALVLWLVSRRYIST